jgi:hypothetical protein
MPSNVFISYRREDSRYQARGVFDAFQKVLPRDSLFMDVDSIPPGADFVAFLEGWVDKCEILLALIGPGWSSSLDPKTARRRIDNPRDFVRIEIREALKRGIPVVPVLLDGTPMPDENELPDDMKSLVRRQAEYIEYRTFDADVNRLIKRLELGKTRASTPDMDTQIVSRNRLSEQWSGHAKGTNNGALKVILSESLAGVRGTLIFEDDAFGPTFYDVAGSYNDQEIRLEGKPQSGGHLEGVLGTLIATGKFISPTEIRGTWKSSIGTAGYFSLFATDAGRT